MLLVYKTKLERGVTITSLQIVFCNTHKSVLIHASSKTLCPAANENEKETHSQTLFKDRGLGIHSSKWDFSIQSMPLENRDLHRKEGKKRVKESKRIEDTRRTNLSKSIELRSYNLQRLRQLVQNIEKHSPGSQYLC